MKTSYTFTSAYQSPIDKLVGLLRRESISYARITDGVRILNLAPNDLVMIRAKIQEFGNITETIDMLDETAEDNQVGLCIPFDRSLTVPAEVMLKSLSAQVFKAVSSITSMKVIDKADYTGELPESFTDKDIFLLEIRGIQKPAKNNAAQNNSVTSDIELLAALTAKSKNFALNNTTFDFDGITTNIHTIGKAEQYKVSKAEQYKSDTCEYCRNGTCTINHNQ